MSFADAAEKLLRDAGKPMTHKELAAAALKQKLVATESETPDINMHVSIRVEMKRREARGQPQRFVFLGNGLFSLIDLVAGKPTQKTKSALEQVRDSRADAAQELYERLISANNGPNFEVMVADLLVALGYQDVQVIGGKDDQGVDIICEKRDGILTNRIAVQCKCKNLRQLVGPKDVSTLRDNLSTYQAQQGIIVTTSRLNDVAKTKAKEAAKEVIHYIEHEQLLDLFVEYSIGIRSEALKFYQLDVSSYDFLK